MTWMPVEHGGILRAGYRLKEHFIWDNQRFDAATVGVYDVFGVRHHKSPETDGQL